MNRKLFALRLFYRSTTLAIAMFCSSQVFATGEAFKELDRPIVVVDVGCRWGFADNFINDLEKFCIYGFDPDEDECNRLERLYHSDKIHLIPKALGDHVEKTLFYLTKNPACSSIYPPDPALTETCPGLDCAKKVSEGEVAMTTLDLWAESANVASIDHIKIDTQGSELLVLKGAERVLHGVRTLEIEVEFNPIYEGQPLFSDVDKFLRERGFVLWKFDNLAHYGHPCESEMILSDDLIHFDYQSAKLMKRGGQLHWANAHYVHKSLVDANIISPQQLMRDITLLDSLGHTDLASRLKKKLAVYFGQFLQDGFVYETFFKNKQGGVFVDIGANRPVVDSNTYFLETMMGWRGVCIEPSPKLFAELKEKRNSCCLNVAVTPSQEGKLQFMQFDKLHGLSGLVENYNAYSKEQIERLSREHNDPPQIISVNAIPINTVLESQQLFHVDFMSLDIEGGELEILKAIDFNRFYIDIISVENNWEDPWYHEAKNSSIRKYMESSGYEYVTKLGVDEVYKRKKK